MTFENEIKEFTTSIPKKLEYIDSEETTKIALITPFLRLLGYDTSDPSTVRAEYTADVGTKQGEKVDFAIIDNDEPIIFIECKSVQNDLNESHISQLYRYFSITDVQIGILTNGLDYRFYTTGDDNRMDDKPFLEVNLMNLSSKDIKELEKFVVDNFDVNDAIDRADNLKYRNSIKKVLLNEFDNPSEEFIKAIGKQAYDGILTQNMKEKFASIIKTVIVEIINEKVEKRLSDAVANNDMEMKKDASEEIANEEKEIKEIADEQKEVKNEVITTDEELEGYYIIKSIASEIISADRVTIRDRKSYCNVLLDDHQNYLIVRFYFNNAENLKIELFDKVEVGHNGMKIGDKIDIEKVSDLYVFKERILNLINEYVEVKSS